MTTADPGLDSAERPRRMGWVAALQEALDRPLASYYLLLGATALLLTIGLIMVLSASSVMAYHTSGNSYSIVEKQFVWVVIGLPLAFLFSRLPQRALRRLAWPGYVVAVLLLIATALVGVRVNGNQNWLSLGGPVQLQPSEMAKFALVLWAAHVYALKEKRLDRLSDLVVPVVPGFVFATMLVVYGHDLGTSVIIFAIMLGLLWVVGVPARFFGVALAGVGGLVALLAITSPERLRRFTTFSDPFKTFHTAGWQAAHGLWALASGGVFGQGIGASQQKWGDLPEAQNDFIFAVLGEELGLVGTLLVVALFLVLAYTIFRIARESRDPFVRYFSAGVGVWVLVQMMINVGMVLALFPVVGIPLPLISYGGSSLVPTLVALGIVIGFARREPEAARALAQRKKSRSAGLAAR